MANKFWIGRSPLIAQVQTFTVTAFDVTTTYKVTIGSVIVSVLGLGTNALTAAAWQAALAASTAGEFQDATWTVGTTTITATSQTPGKPFTMAISVSGGAGTISGITTVTANSSPNDWGDAVNYSGSTLPTDNDTIILENGSVPAMWRLDALAALTGITFRVLGTFTGTWSLPTANSSGYPEYRPTDVSFASCTTLYVEQASGVGTAGQKIHVGTAAAITATIIGNGSGQIGSEVLWIQGGHASSTLSIAGGGVYLAALSSQAANFSTIAMTAGAVLNCGIGTAAVTTLAILNSTLNIESNITTLVADGSSTSITCWGTMVVTDATISAGNVVWNSSGGIGGDMILGSQTNTATLDLSQATSSLTFLNPLTEYAGSVINDPFGRIAAAAAFTWTIPNGNLGDCPNVFGTGRTYTSA